MSNNEPKPDSIAAAQKLNTILNDDDLEARAIEAALRGYTMGPLDTFFSHALGDEHDREHNTLSTTEGRNETRAREAVKITEHFLIVNGVSREDTDQVLPHILDAALPIARARIACEDDGKCPPSSPSNCPDVTNKSTGTPEVK